MGIAAQVRQPGESITAGEGSGTLSDESGPLRGDSVPVYGSGTIGEASGGPVRSGPVRGGGTRSMRSGPVSGVSAGPMREPRPPVTSGSMTEWSSGAVKHDVTTPLGTRISEPLREIGALQAALRAQREQAQLEALTGVPAAALSPEEEAAMQMEAERAAQRLLQQVEVPAPPADHDLPDSVSAAPSDEGTGHDDATSPDSLSAPAQPADPLAPDAAPEYPDADEME